MPNKNKEPLSQCIGRLMTSEISVGFGNTKGDDQWCFESSAENS